MTTIFLVVLFFIQITGFYFLALLYTKVSKFDDLEKKQRKLMEEMDDSIGAYLAELKDENERLIAKLAERDARSTKQEQENHPFLAIQETTEASKETQPQPLIDMPKMPVNLALKSYNNTIDAHGTTSFEPAAPVTVDEKTHVLELHRAGHSVEEIAKMLGKGRTEVELILKFK